MCASEKLRRDSRFHASLSHYVGRMERGWDTFQLSHGVNTLAQCVSLSLVSVCVCLCGVSADGCVEGNLCNPYICVVFSQIL